MDAYFVSKWGYYDHLRKDIGSYVKDGLILWLDGIKNSRDGHDASARKWEDISGSGYDFTPKTSGKYPTVGDKYFTGFTADTFFVSQSTALNAFGPVTSAGTLEVVYMPTASHTGHVFGFKNVTGSSAALYKLAVKNQANLCVAGRYTTATNSRYLIDDIGQLVDTMCFISITYGGSISTIKVDVNGTAYTELTPGNSGWGNNGAICVGNRWHTGSSTSYPFQGRIYCIRYYSRVLTDEERAHNKEIDKARFGA